MIERLLAAEGALARDELDHAARMFGQVADADPRNAIAIVGLARVAAQRGDADAARAHLAHALEIDPDEAAARRLLLELDATAVESPPTEPEPATPGPFATPTLAPVAAPAPAPRSFLDRLLGWLGLRRRA
jgi:thioredoxin-like negative regulator of GroEL